MLKIKGIDSLDKFILDNENNNIILYFGANWCGPCKKLKDKIDEYNISEKIPICYIDIDQDENKEISDIYEVKFLPTQVFIKLDNNKIKIINRIDGYDWSKFLFIIENIEN
jgi:thiol-disulfide isomerase/thioredoxin